MLDGTSFLPLNQVACLVLMRCGPLTVSLGEVFHEGSHR